MKKYLLSVLISNMIIVNVQSIQILKGLDLPVRSIFIILRLKQLESRADSALKAYINHLQQMIDTNNDVRESLKGSNVFFFDKDIQKHRNIQQNIPLLNQLETDLDEQNKFLQEEKNKALREHQVNVKKIEGIIGNHLLNGTA